MLEEMCKICQILLLAFALMANGDPRNNRRLQYGFEKVVSEFPYYGLVEIKTVQPEGEIFHFCGSAIIKPQYLLSAAHCYSSHDNITALHVHVDISNRRPGVQYELNPTPDIDYDFSNSTDGINTYYYSDLAVLTVIGKMTFNKHVQSIMFDEYESQFHFPPFEIIHFVGVKHYSINSPIVSRRELPYRNVVVTILNSTKRLITSTHDCKPISEKYLKYNTNAMCSLPIGTPEEKYCFGSVGSPVVYKPGDAKKRRLIGIVSDENKCDQFPLPFVSIAKSYFYIKLILDPI